MSEKSQCSLAFSRTAMNLPRGRHGSMLVMRTAIALLCCLAISGCGMAKAARETGQTFDKYGCLARDFKGQPPCEPDNAAAP